MRIGAVELDVDARLDLARPCRHHQHTLREAVYLADRVAVMSARPGRVKAVIETRFDKNDPDLFKSKAFVEKTDEIWTLVRDEALKAQEKRG